MTGGGRLVLALALVSIAPLVFLFGYLREGASSEPSMAAALPSKYDDRILALERDAIERAFGAQVQHLYATWMKDAAGQPARATIGAQQARRAYLQSMEALERRQQQLNGARP